MYGHLGKWVLGYGVMSYEMRCVIWERDWAMIGRVDGCSTILLKNYSHPPMFLLPPLAAVLSTSGIHDGS